MTVNSSDKDVGRIVRDAQLLSQRLSGPGEQAPPSADDLLLFLYRLRDGYRIVRSSSSRFKGSTFSFLHELLYQLESRPDEALRSDEWRTFIEALLRDLSSGKLILAQKKS